MACLIERYSVMPSKIKHDSYGVYDRLEERFVISAVVADTPTEAYDIAWRLKDKQDQLHEEGSSGVNR